ncbi:MAG: hypothetical protein ACHQ16_08330, partial [Candidatus Lutacidiplasmatales archaeon]
ARAAPMGLPTAQWGDFLGGLTVPALAPASSGVISFTVADPLGVPLSGVVLTLGLYEFNAYPGNATGPVPSPNPEFSGPGLSPGSSIAISVGNLTPGGAEFSSPGSLAVTVSVPSGAPEGTYAIRTSLVFRAGGDGYLLESRGFFSAAQWENATASPGTPSALNATRLGVSGVIPESGLLVRSNPFPVALAVVLGGALVLAGVGGYWAVRRGPRSKSGAKAGPPPSQAETALGKRRSNDGD